MRLRCANHPDHEEFYAKIVEYHSCKVDANGTWAEDLGCDDADRPGEFTCTICGAEVDFVY